MGGGDGAVAKYLSLAAVTSLVFGLATVVRLTSAPLDRARAAGVMTEDRSSGERAARRVLFLIDPQRRSRGISPLVNPVTAKEFMSRKLGRSHWTLRLVAGTAILSLLLSYVASTGALGWGSEATGGALVVLQTALLVLFVPSLAAGLISSEREGKTWQLLRMTPLSPGRVLRGKLLSAAWPVLLLMCGTMPGYVAMATIEPTAAPQTQRVVVCLALMALFAVMASAAASSLFETTAAATAAANITLVAVCLAPLLVWLGRGIPFGHSTVEAALSVSPVAAALHASNTAGFKEYNLLPLSWWISGVACALLLVVLVVRTRQLCRPE
jgi:ABC-type transport system involved in multi-copper enzyme maturation permease subunit